MSEGKSVGESSVNLITTFVIWVFNSIESDGQIAYPIRHLALFFQIDWKSLLARSARVFKNLY